MDHASQAAQLFNKLAIHYQDRYMDVSAYGSVLDEFIGLFKEPSPSLLDIACGPGNITRYLLDRLPTARILGTDLAPAMIELARVNCPTASFEVMDCRKTDQLNQQFDGVVAGFCLPYLNPEEADQLIGDISHLLKKNGLLYLSTIEGEREKSGPRKGSTGDEVYQYYYSSADIRNWLQQHGFRLISQHSAIMPGNIHADLDLQVIAEKE